MTLTVLCSELAEAVAKDEQPENGGCDLSAGMFGPFVSEWLRKVAAEIDGDGKKWRDLLQLAGHWQDGSDTPVALMQDDATRECGIKVGYASKFAKPPRSYWGGTFAAALAVAVKGES